MKTYDKPLLECYIRLYKHSTPSANFQELMDNAEINELGQKVIPFDDYFLSEEKQNKIIDDICKEYKIPKYIRSRFKTTIILGCSPRYTKKK